MEPYIKSDMDSNINCFKILYSLKICKFITEVNVMKR